MVTSNIHDYKCQFFQPIILFFFGVIGTLSFSPYNFWLASIVSFSGLLTQILNITWKKAAWYTFFWGVGFFGSGLYWVYISINQMNIKPCYYMNFFLMLLFIFYLTLFPILFSIIFTMIQSKKITWCIISSAPTLWSITEYFRGNLFTGFPWLQFGYSQIDGPLKGIAPILGVEGITFFLIFISSLVTISIKTMQIFPILLSLAMLLFLWPLNWIQWYNEQPQRSIDISLIQGNVEKRVVWDANHTKKSLKIYIQHTESVLNKSKIIIWPESTILNNKKNYSELFILLENFLRKNQISLITGIIDTLFIRDKFYHYNSIIVLGEPLSDIGINHNRYIKHHLVPFSERSPSKILIPLFNFFNFPILFMEQGNYLQPPLIVSNIKITAMICYEAIFNYQIRNNFQFDTDLLLTIADNIWFGNSIEPWQYLQIIRMRALELGRPLLCSTNNGITAVIYPNGSIQAQLPQFISSILNVKVTPSIGTTPYVKFGPSLFWMMNIFFSIITVLCVSKNTIG